MNNCKRNIYQSAFNQRNRARRVYKSRDLLHDFGLCYCEAWLDKSEVHIAGCQKDRLELWLALKLQSTGRIPHQGMITFSLKVYQLIEFYACVLNCFSHVWLFVTLWTVACQAPLSMEFSRQELLEWVAIPFSRGIFPTQGLNRGLPLCKWILYQLSWQLILKVKLCLS